MLKNKIIVRKIRNIVILLMVLLIMLGAYKNIDNSLAEDIIELTAIAVDNYGYLSDEEIKLEAKQAEGDLYEIELPESVNGKKIEQTMKVKLEDIIDVTSEQLQETTNKNISTEEEAVEQETTNKNISTEEEAVEQETTNENISTEEEAEAVEQETTNENISTEEEAEELEQETVEQTENAEENTIEIIDNKIYLTQEQIENKQVNLEVVYGVAILETNEENEYNKILLSEKTEEERKALEITEETEMLYSKILRYEDETNEKIVEVRGYMPKDAELQIEEVSQEKLAEIFGTAKIDVAYDIKIIVKVINKIPEDEVNLQQGKIETTEVAEIIEINPEDYGEICEVSIKDANIQEQSQVYHVKEDNKYEKVPVKESIDKNISFEAQTFSVYAVSADEMLNAITAATSKAITMSSTTLPYLPSGYTRVSGTGLDGGLVIQDGSGNQYVWIEVPKTTTVYPTAGLNITSFTDAEYTKIENDLHTYTSTYRQSAYAKDAYYSDALTGLSSANYTALKKKMLKSIYLNGGFYIGRYETGIANSFRTSGTTPNETPVIKANAYPYNYVKTSQAQSLASRFGSGSFASSLLFGVQWDLVLKHLETKGVSQSVLKSSSKSWGNFYSTTFSIGSSAKYSTSLGASYTAGPWSKTSSKEVIVTTGASSIFNKYRIYDLAGNLWEMTLEYSGDSTYPANYRGAAYATGEDNYAASIRVAQTATNYGRSAGFRVALYKDGQATSSELISDAESGTRVEIKNVTRDGYDVYIHNVINDGTVSALSFPTWTNANGQDDITWENGTNQGNGTWYYRVNVSSHNNEEGTYYTHIYMTNTSGVTSFLNGAGAYVDRTPPNPGTLTASKYYTNSNTVTIYINQPTDDHSGIDSEKVQINGWYGVQESGNFCFSNGTVKYDSTNDRYYSEFAFNSIVNSTTNATNNGEGTYQFDGHLFDKANNHKPITPPVTVVYDVTKPKIKYSSSYIDYDNKTLTIVFNATDKYFSSSSLTASDLQIQVDGVSVSELSKSLSSKDITNGKQYTLVISNWTHDNEGNYLDYSGIVTMVVPSGKVLDLAGNTNNQTTITVGMEANTQSRRILYTRWLYSS